MWGQNPSQSGLWVVHEIVNKTYAENMKTIVGAVWDLPAKQHSQSSSFPLKLEPRCDASRFHAVEYLDYQFKQYYHTGIPHFLGWTVFAHLFILEWCLPIPTQVLLHFGMGNSRRQ